MHVVAVVIKHLFALALVQCGKKIKREHNTSVTNK